MADCRANEHDKRDEFLEDIATKVEELIYDKNSINRMAEFRQQITPFGEKFKAYCAASESKRSQLSEYSQKAKGDPKLRDKDAGAADKGKEGAWIWDPDLLLNDNFDGHYRHIPAKLVPEFLELHQELINKEEIELKETKPETREYRHRKRRIDREKATHELISEGYQALAPKEKDTGSVEAPGEWWRSVKWPGERFCGGWRPKELPEIPEHPTDRLERSPVDKAEERELAYIILTIVHDMTVKTSVNISNGIWPKELLELSWLIINRNTWKVYIQCAFTLVKTDLDTEPKNNSRKGKSRNTTVKTRGRPRVSDDHVKAERRHALKKKWEDYAGLEAPARSNSA